MNFLRRVADVFRRDEVRSLAIRKGLGIVPLLLRFKRSQLRWFSLLLRKSPDHHPRDVFQAHLAGKRPQDRPRSSSSASGEIISLHWPGNALGSPSQSWLMWPGKEMSGDPC